MSDATEAIGKAQQELDYWKQKRKELHQSVVGVERKIYDAECAYIKARWGIAPGTIVVDRDGEEWLVSDPNGAMYIHQKPTIRVRKRKKDGTWSDRHFTLYGDHYTVKASAGHA